MKKIILALVVVLTAATSTTALAWPRSFVNADGSTTTIPTNPVRVLSTSVTVTGTLLAIEAPLIASATDTAGRFFGQWQVVANERSVAKLWPAGSVDLESAYLNRPDLIVVSKSGADSALNQIKEFRAIAPTIIVDYSTQSWQDLAKQLGDALGSEKHVEKTVAEFDLLVANTKAQLNLPDGKVNIISYHGAGVTNAVAKPEGAHALLLSALGFQLESPDYNWHTGPLSHSDFLRVNYEKLTLLKAETSFLLEASDQHAQRLMSNKVLKNLPSVKNHQVYGLGENTFRVDLYSSKEIINNMLRRFGSE
ncbi:Fe2+-enterobactin ABC transporter substrate-binding protein [Vibrio tapetis subsp. quintayensis]|uniref:Fe2+-enterobactin ABC transporter substrate-binding protein n=1 Tax=Vibrio tapetis TaxID=52443 RepID=UPI0025B4EE64|nr:Fe2+-enterobactin ABC transporter substrate-binding protein [Vibrio tapetis]MDN3680884.1 Fe2+-enterobactin ABC transporter substrate-binding protein [Vibrio tapetis subsp. quintayensis]